MQCIKISKKKMQRFCRLGFNILIVANFVLLIFLSCQGDESKYCLPLFFGSEFDEQYPTIFLTQIS